MLKTTTKTKTTTKSKKKATKLKKKKRIPEKVIMERTLLVANTICLIIGFAGLVLAGLIDPKPLHRLDTTGGQLTFVAIYTIFLSLIGLYGVRYRSFPLLMTYGVLIVFALIIRSLISLLSSTVIGVGTSTLFLMITALFEVILLLFAFAVAIDYRRDQKKLIEKGKTDIKVQQHQQQEFDNNNIKIIEVTDIKSEIDEKMFP